MSMNSCSFSPPSLRIMYRGVALIAAFVTTA